MTLDEYIKKVESFEKKVDKAPQKILEKVAEAAVIQAESEFSIAEYDGINDVSVSSEVKDGTATIKAEGSATLFIEFGTGITSPDNHPEKPSVIAARGTYGKGKGANPNGWVYVGATGTNGESVGNGKVRTKGNIANACMYNTKKIIEETFSEIAEEALHD